ncbi:Ribbon-helix-helix protein, copG family [Xenococcus sp. PCC 7305]|uniref:ribbon-helix-helix protein, CopG family n=1 Tax=Xenococcus sp. PCC 7305 TaxID=102125 RepID=UPI0002ABC2C5|nr:ribbon-helix-helix protein, CopG family [Xenococcus sp. PCC 7305]ELS05184.1 Ribbon-helix-helix protein, copG family [Xenococcus sp. PCC 7305]
MKRFSLRLTEAEYRKVKSYCEELQVSMNDVLRQLVREWSPSLEMSEKANKKEKITD